MQNSINFTLVKQLRVLRLNAFQFYRHLLAGGHVRPEVDVAEGTGADLTPEAVFLAHAQLHDFIDLLGWVRWVSGVDDGLGIVCFGDI